MCRTNLFPCLKTQYILIFISRMLKTNYSVLHLFKFILYAEKYILKKYLSAADFILFTQEKKHFILKTERSLKREKEGKGGNS